MFDEEFANRLANLERSVQTVGQGRQSYMSSAISSTLSRGAVGPAAPFRVSFIGSSEGGSGAPARPADYVDYSSYSAAGSGYDPSAMPAASLLRNKQQQQQSLGRTALGAVMVNPGGEQQPSPTNGASSPSSYYIDPYSEAFSTCPRCAHLGRLEESVAAVEEQYRLEIEHLRHMMSQIDNDRVDVVQRLRTTQEDLEAARAQNLDKERQGNEWRQRALVAEEQVSMEQRMSTSSLWDVTRRASFMMEYMQMMFATIEMDSRTELLSSEQVARAACWSQVEFDRLSLLKGNQLIKLRKEQERLVLKELQLKEVEMTLQKRWLSDTGATVVGQRRMGNGSAAPPSSVDVLSNKSSLHNVNINIKDRTTSPLPPQQQLTSSRGGDGTRRSMMSTADGLRSMTSDSGIPQVHHDAGLTTEELSIPQDLALEPPGRLSAVGEGISREVPPHGAAEQALSADVSFGDLDLDDADSALGTAAIAGGEQQPRSAGNSAHVLGAIERYQALLADSEAARKQLEGHLLTEQQYSNALQSEVDDLMTREAEAEEHIRRLKLELNEMTFRNEMALQSKRRVCSLLFDDTTTNSGMMKTTRKGEEGGGGATRPPPVEATTATTTAAAVSAAPSSSSFDGVDVPLLQKELSVLRKLYTEAKEEANTVRKELQDSKLLLDMSLMNNSQNTNKYESTAEAVAVETTTSPPPPPPTTLVTNEKQQPEKTNVPPPPAVTSASATIVDIDAIVRAVAERLNAPLSTMQSSLDFITKQLTVADDDDEEPVAVAAGSVVELANSQATTILVGTGGDSQVLTSPVLHGSLSSGTTSNAVLMNPTVSRVSPATNDMQPTLLRRRISATSGGFASILIQRVQAAADLNRSALEHSMHETEVKINELSEHVRSLKSTPEPSILVVPSSSSTLGGGPAATAPPALMSSSLPGSSTPEGSQTPHMFSRTGTPPPKLGAAASNAPDSLSLTQLHEAMASMRNIMRNVLFTTSHNQKLIGERLDELSIAQKSMMNELVQSTSGHGLQHPQNSPLAVPQVLLPRAILEAVNNSAGSPPAVAPYNVSSPPVTFSIPPALRGAGGKPTLSLSVQDYQAEDMQRQQAAATAAAASAAVAAAFQFASLQSPPAPPLPQFSKVSPTAGGPHAHFAVGSSLPPVVGVVGGGGGVSTDATANSDHSGSLQRRASHRWDEEDDDASPLKRSGGGGGGATSTSAKGNSGGSQLPPAVSASSSSNNKGSRWHTRASQQKTPYDDDDEEEAA